MYSKELFKEWSIGDINGGRLGQAECIRAFVDKCNKRKAQGDLSNFVFSIIMACRYGKSDVIRCIAVEALRLMIASCALVIHPFPELARQFLDGGRLLLWQKRWMPILASDKIQIMTDFGEEPMANGEWIGSVHIQALTAPGRRLYIEQWVENKKNETGLPPIIFIDETQSYSNNTWGEIPRLFQKLGCPIVVCTATPFRNDGDDVFGFYGEQVSSESVRQISHKPNPEDDKTLIKTTTDKRVSEFEVTADVEVGFQVAWNEKVISKASLLSVDYVMKKCGDGKDGQTPKLSELSETDARLHISDLVRDPGFITEVVKEMVRQLDGFRRAGVRNPAAIVFGANDESGNRQSNGHLEQIRDEIQRQSDLKCVVATMAVDNANQKIADFCSPTKMEGDVLLLKQMGSVGLDIDRCCVVVLLGPVRSQGQVIQQAMRGGNITSTKQHFVIIYPHEKIMVRILDDWISENGGIYKKEEIEHIESEIVPKGEGKDRGGFIPLEATDSGASDHEGDAISSEEVRLADFFLSVCPDQKTGKTYPQLVRIARALNISVPADFQKEDTYLVETTAVVDKMRGSLFEIVKDVAKMMFEQKYRRKFDGSNPSDRAEVGKLKSIAAARIKTMSGVDKSWDAGNPDRSESLEEYRKWVAAGRRIIEEGAR